MGRKLMKRCSVSLIITETDIKATGRYHLPLRRRAMIKKKIIAVTLVRAVEKPKPLCIRWECTMVQMLWKTLWLFFRKLH